MSSIVDEALSRAQEAEGCDEYILLLSEVREEVCTHG